MTSTPKQSPNPRRRLLLGSLTATVASLLLLSAPGARAANEDWPNRSIRMIVPFAVGGATDVVARLVADKLSSALGQPVVVDNRGGANGVIGTELAARAAPDGYTLLLNTAGAQTLSPYIQTANYQPLDSFEPISLIARIGLVLIAHPSLPVQSVQELQALLKKPGAKPLSMSSGSSMIGLISDQLIQLLDADIVNAQYKGTGPQLQALVSGEVDLTIDPFVGMAMIAAGKARPLAVLSDQRSPALPDVPTMKEAGIKDMTFGSWAGLLAPKGTPTPIITRLNREILQIVERPDVREAFRRIDYEPVGSTPEAFATVIRDDAQRWERIAKTSKYKPGS